MDQREKDFWNRIANKVPGHVQRIETTIGCGIPDVNACYLGIEAWIELKIVDPVIGILVRTAQWSWHNRRMFHGGSKKCILLAHDIASDRIIYIPFGLMKIIPYGNVGKYVQVDLVQSGHITVKFDDLNNVLKTKLFTKD